MAVHDTRLERMDRMEMRTKTPKVALVGASIVVAAAIFALGSGGVHAASGTRLCTWGGTPANPTGVVTLDPGATNTPSSGPSKLHAWGPLEGDGCQGTMTFQGIAKAGSGCRFSTFEGRVEGLPGVTRFDGAGSGPFVSEYLYDSDGNVVGADQPVLKAFGAGDRFSDGLDCNTPEGFTRGQFSATVELYN
jgi:hypothetical protein